jgi:DNA polymerase-3 subunit gamma/tau
MSDPQSPRKSAGLGPGSNQSAAHRPTTESEMPPLPPLDEAAFDEASLPFGPDSAWEPDGAFAAPAKPARAIEDWAELVEGAEVRGGARQLADHCELASASETRIELILAAEKETLNTQQIRSRLESAIGQYLGRRITLVITPGDPPRPTPAERRAANENARMRGAREAMEQDPNVKAVQDAFGAVLEADSIQPIQSIDEGKRGSGR